MNVFRGRKKGTDAGDGASTAGSSSGALFSIGRKGKKGQVEVKPPVDLATVLPSSDDFRTSLLMPNLSARFSMLREQDDPTSKLGKANDDSVLFPKRASRLNLFNRTPTLGDIDEAASINSSIRPAFLKERSGSYTSLDGYGTDDDGTVMNRNRPVEGNNLFGGRQKIYKISEGASSPKPLMSPVMPSSPLPGKAVYENDVSSFNFKSAHAKEQGIDDKRSGSSLDHVRDFDHDDHESASSPSVGFSKNRGTQSSTASGPSNRRTSTAATSIDSQIPPYHSNQNSSSLAGVKGNVPPSAPLDRNTTIHRRLYGVAGDQGSAPQTSVLRNPSLSQSKSATQLHDRFQRPSPITNNSAFRTTSPPPSATPPGSGQGERGRADSKGQEGDARQGFGYIPPLSPPISEGDDATTYVNSIQPEDRGKATALGLFNRPAKQYDDQQFLQRQMQLHEARSGSPLPKPIAPPPTSALPSLPSVSGRNRSNASSTSSRSQSNQATTPRDLPTQMGTDKLVDGFGSTKTKPNPIATDPGTSQGTFLELVSPSDEEAEKKPLEPPESRSRQSVALSEKSNTSRIRDRSSSASSHRSLHEYSSIPGSVPMRNHVDIMEPIPSPTDDAAADSPTLGPGMGLSGLIRAHLRQDSDKSSIYQPKSPRLTQDAIVDSPGKDRSVPSARTLNQPESVHSNPWEFEDAFRRNTKQLSMTSPSADSAIPTMSQKAKQILGQATALKEQAIGLQAPQQNGQSPEKKRSKSPDGQTWQEVLNAKHYRGGSTETEREREDFENELADRKRRVQERLRSVTESNSRANSPVPGAAKAGNAFSMLRQKTTRVPTGQTEPQKKAMKMLGIGNATMSSSSPRMAQDELWKEEEERMLADFSRRPKPRSPHVPRSPHMPRSPHAPPAMQQPPVSARQYRGPGGTDHLDDSTDSNHRAATPSSFKGSRRDRSSSDLSGGRSRSRNDRHRDDLDRTAPDGVGRLKDMSPSFPPNISIPPRPPVENFERRPNPYERSASAASGRYRNGSRPPPPQTEYFEKENLLPIQTQGPGFTARPSPYLNAYSASSTPTIPDGSPNYSAASTPGWNPQDQAPNHPNTSRKRSVTKGMISEPTFLSSTSTISTYGLRTGPSPGGNGHFPHENDSPPIPMMNPRRRRPTLTQTMVSPGMRHDVYDGQQLPKSAIEDRSHFSDDPEKKPQRQRQRLRKSSSEGGSLNARARQHAMAAPSPAMPNFPRQPRMHGGMI